MKGLNRVSLMGHLGKNPEVLQLSGGTVVAKVSMATTESFRDTSGQLKLQTDWHSLVLWGKLAEFAGTHLRKGTKLFVEGKLKNRKYCDKAGVVRYVTEVIADNIVML